MHEQAKQRWNSYCVYSVCIGHLVGEAGASLMAELPRITYMPMCRTLHCFSLALRVFFSVCVANVFYPQRRQTVAFLYFYCINCSTLLILCIVKVRVRCLTIETIVFINSLETIMLDSFIILYYSKS